MSSPNFEEISEQLWLQSSTGRLGHLVDYLEGMESPRDFWHLFHEFWPMCDSTWEWQDELKDLFCAHGHGRRYFKKEQREFYKSLPESIVAYRGCSAERFLGVSWTTNYEVAFKFARGHRYIATPDPVIATARIPKSKVRTVCLDRNESEILWMPDRAYLDDPESFDIEPFDSPGFDFD